MKERQRMMGVAIGSLDRCVMELKSILNHSEGLNPDVQAEIYRIYSEFAELSGALEDLEEEL